MAALLKDALKPNLIQTLENTPAIKSGLQVNDKIIEINGQQIKTWNDIVNNLQKETSKDKVNIKIERNNTTKELSITPEKNEQGKYVIGISPVYEKSIIKSIPKAFVETGNMINSGFLDGLGKEEAIDKMIVYLEENNIFSGIKDNDLWIKGKNLKKLIFLLFWYP